MSNNKTANPSSTSSHILILSSNCSECYIELAVEALPAIIMISIH